jgi:hypothetical protein
VVEKIVLGVILAVAVFVLTRIVWRSVRRASKASGAQGCGDCPFIEKCKMSADGPPHARERTRAAELPQEREDERT